MTVYTSIEAFLSKDSPLLMSIVIFTIMAVGWILCLADWKAYITKLTRICDRKRATRSLEEDSCEQPSVVITLVHGTFARGSKWTKPGSKIRARIAAEIGGTVHFKVFKWSGFNTFSARRQAAHRLANELDESANAWRSASQIIVSHSHGGNVALKALILCRTPNPPIGLVCISTPFLVATKVSLPVSLKVAPSILLLATFVTIILGALAAFTPVLNGSVVLATVGASLVGGMLIVSGEKMFRWESELTHHIHNGDPDEFKSLYDKVLIIRQPADEASALLATAHFASWTSAHILSAFLALTDFGIRGRQRLNVSRSRKLMFLAVLGGAIQLTYMSFVTENPLFKGAEFIAYILAVITIFGLLLAVLSGLCIAVAVAFIAMSLCTAAAMGWELLIIGPGLRVTAESSPLGTWRIVTLQPESDTGKRISIRRLTHSLLYQDSKGLEVIVRWIVSRLRETRGTAECSPRR
ncbi:lipase family protein [Paraburkholderia phytofirmans]|uniref:hypothetical protein n=1 Tax=Paraburkholderia phytofirmans TaxID=261302 RepID=UPI0038B7CFCE